MWRIDRLCHVGLGMTERGVQYLHITCTHAHMHTCTHAHAHRPDTTQTQHT